MTTRRSRVLVLVLAAFVLAPGALVAYAMPTGGSQHTAGIPGLPGFVGQAEGDLRNAPGNPVRGLAVFREFCSGCHNFKAAGLQGKFKTGSDLDARKPTFARIVTLIVQGGGGGLPSKQLLQELSFEQIYDVAAFVALYAGKSGPVRGAKVAPPIPISLAATLKPMGSTGAASVGRFTATLSGTALNWRLVLRGATKAETSAAHIELSVPGSSVKPMELTCERCNKPGLGFVMLSQAQAKALGTGHAKLVVEGPDGTVGGEVVKAG
jgi:mono/diheme cytochrome c family protein